MDEDKNKETKNPDIVEIAKRKRHLFLYEKLQGNKPLSQAELKELEALEGSGLPSGIVNTKEKVARALNVSVRTVYYWEKDSMPVMPEGNYDLLEIKAWRMTRQKHKNLADTKKDKWDIEYRKNKALLAKLEYEKAIGEVLFKNEVIAKEVWAIQTVKAAFLALPTILAPTLAMKEPREIYPILDDAIRQILREFAGNYRYSKDKENRVNAFFS